MPPMVVQMEFAGMRRANQHDNVSQDAPASDVVDRSAGDGNRSETAPQHVPLGQNSRQQREKP